MQAGAHRHPILAVERRGERVSGNAFVNRRDERHSRLVWLRSEHPEPAELENPLMQAARESPLVGTDLLGSRLEVADGRSEPGDPRQVGGARLVAFRAGLGLLGGLAESPAGAALDERQRAAVGREIEHADPLRSEQGLVAGGRPRVDPERFEVDIEMTGGLRSVDEDCRPGRVRDRGKLGDGLDGGRHVAGMLHDRKPHGSFRKRGGEPVDVNQALRRSGNAGDSDPRLREPGERTRHGVVLDRGGDHSVAGN